MFGLVLGNVVVGILQLIKQVFDLLRQGIVLVLLVVQVLLYIAPSCLGQ